MNISPVNINQTSFRANVARQTSSPEDTLAETYNSKIREIETARDLALELDTYMHSDDVKKVLDGLPKDDTIKIVGDFSLYASSDDDFYIKEPFLFYEDKTRQLPVKICNYCPIEDGKVDKEGTKGWLQGISKMIQLIQQDNHE